MDQQPLRWGILGSGKISHDFCVALSTLPQTDHKVIYTSSKDLAKAKDFAAKFDIANFTDNYEELVKHSDVDVIYIGTLNPTHKDLSILALNHKKAVLCEKPIAMNSKELKEVLECAKTNNVFFMEALWTRFNPFLNEVITEIKSLKYGSPNSLHGEFGFKMFNKVERINKLSLGGSVLTDIGIYLINIADMIFGDHKVKDMEASGHIDEVSGVDRTVLINILYEDSKSAQLHTTGDQELSNEVVIYCENAKITLHRPFHATESYSIEVAGSNDKTTITQHLPKAKLTTNFVNSVALRYEAEHVRQCLIAGKVESPVMSQAKSLQMLDTLDEIRKQIGLKFAQD